MRYLKSKSVFEEFETLDSIKNDIKDIFIELIDNYLDVEVSSYSHDYGKVLISKKSEHLTDSEFNIDSDIIDSILRFIDYLGMNKLYLKNITIKKLRLSSVSGLRRWVVDDLNVTNVTEEGLFISEFNINKYQNKLFTDPVHKIVIEYSNKNL